MAVIEQHYHDKGMECDSICYSVLQCSSCGKTEGRYKRFKPISPVDHGMKMYEINLKSGMTHEQALFRALCCACNEQRGRCEETVEDAGGDPEPIEKMPPVNIDPKTGILR